MPTKIFCRNFILLLAAFAGGIAVIQAFSYERAWCVENSKKKKKKKTKWLSQTKEEREGGEKNGRGKRG